MYLISTVGEYLPDAPVREIFAQSRGVALEGMGDKRRAHYMEKIGFEDIGYGRKYETMVFSLNGKVCAGKGCGCGMPVPSDWRELDAERYNTAGDATRGHRRMVQKYLDCSINAATEDSKEH